MSYKISIPVAACLYFFALTSCHVFGKKSDSKTLQGDWLILYPEHRLKTIEQRAVYGRHQDSLVNLYGLKLVGFADDGRFVEIDSFGQGYAKWTLTQTGELKVQEGGRGFNPLNTTLRTYSNDSAGLKQTVLLEGERIELVWHLKRVEEDNEASLLFEPTTNAWRKKPSAPEDEETMRKRLSEMLTYYSTYFNLVSKEAIYFSPARVPLPLNYYQHAIGVREELNSSFQNLFYDGADAQKANDLLQKAVGALDNNLAGNNYVEEYAEFLAAMSKWMKK